MESWSIKGHTLEYDDDEHIYLVDGVIVPSITQILQVKFKNKYDKIDPDVLSRAAERGTAIHKAIEDYCNIGVVKCKEASNFRFLECRYNFTPIENESPVILFKHDKPVAAGRFDLLLYIDNEVALADIKTTSTLDKTYLAYQLNLYKLAYEQCYLYTKINRPIKTLYGIHLREDKRKMVEIPVNESIAWDILEQYERSKANE